MTRMLSRHEPSGFVYVVDLDVEVPGDPVQAISEGHTASYFTNEDNFLVGQYAVHINDVPLSTDDVKWAEQEFNTGRLIVVSRTELLPESETA